MDAFVTLGMFIIDEFTFQDEHGNPTGKTLDPQGSIYRGGGTYAAIGARIWMPPHQVAAIVDKGDDLPFAIQETLESYGPMWIFRDRVDARTTRALNSYTGDIRNFCYLTPRKRLTPNDLRDTRLPTPSILHMICSPNRASDIIAEIHEVNDWHPITVYEPIPDRCIPDELPNLIRVLPSISILSPNAEEAFSLLSIVPAADYKFSCEEAAQRLLDYGIGRAGSGAVIIRCGAMGSYTVTRTGGGQWIDAYWSSGTREVNKVADVTGAGNSFLGGLGAGLIIENGNVYEASFYASVSASFVIEQQGLPKLSSDGRKWNGDNPNQRLKELKALLENRKLVDYKIQAL